LALDISEYCGYDYPYRSAIWRIEEAYKTPLDVKNAKLNLT
jgi:hypothetical protein